MRTKVSNRVLVVRTTRFLGSLICVVLIGCLDPLPEDSLDGIPLKTGWFIDSGVEGLRVVVAGVEFSTGAAGSFPYVRGEKVSFFLGDIPLGRVRVPSNGIVTPLDLVGVTIDDPLEFLLPMCAFVGAFCSDLARPIAMTDDDLAVYAMLVLFVNIDADEDPSNGIQITRDQAAVASALFLDFSDRSVFRLLNDNGALDVDENEGFFSTVINPLRAAADLGAITGEDDTVSAALDAILHFHASLYMAMYAGDWRGNLHGAGVPKAHRMDITARIDAFGRVQERFIFNGWPPAGRVEGLADGSLFSDLGSDSIDLDLTADVDPADILAAADAVEVVIEGSAEPYVVRGRWQNWEDRDTGDEFLFDEGDFWLDPSGDDNNALLHMLFTRSGDRVRITRSGDPLRTTGSENDRTVIGLSDANDHLLSVPVQLEMNEYLHFTVLREDGEEDYLDFCSIWDGHIGLREMTVYIDPRKIEERADALKCFANPPEPL
jgi:hypothetical protein